MADELLTTIEVLTLAGMPEISLRRCIASGIVKPVAVEGRSHFWSRLHALALGVFHGLRRRGVKPRGAAAAMEWLLTRGLERLEADLAAGRKFLVIMGTAVADGLLSAEQLDDYAPEIGELAWPSAPLALDVAFAWKGLLLALAKMRGDDVRQDAPETRQETQG